MLFPFKLRIFKQHKGRKQDGWLRFDFSFELNDCHIIGFEEHVLWDEEGVPTRCTQIFFSDGDSVYGCYSFDKFKEIYETEYQQEYVKMITARMTLDGELEEEKKPGPLKRLVNWLW